jgi:hypothetical protein
VATAEEERETLSLFDLLKFVAASQRRTPNILSEAQTAV